MNGAEDVIHDQVSANESIDEVPPETVMGLKEVYDILEDLRQDAEQFCSLPVSQSIRSAHQTVSGSFVVEELELPDGIFLIESKLSSALDDLLDALEAYSGFPMMSSLRELWGFFDL